MTADTTDSTTYTLYYRPAPGAHESAIGHGLDRATAEGVRRTVRGAVRIAPDAPAARCEADLHPAPAAATDACVWCRINELEARLAAADAKAAHLRALLIELERERDAEIVAWLAKKAREYRSTGSQQHAVQADVIELMASKIDRGAVRAPTTRSVAPGGADCA